jgi:hypothetical protein
MIPFLGSAVYLSGNENNGFRKKRILRLSPIRSFPNPLFSCQRTGQRMPAMKAPNLYRNRIRTDCPWLFTLSVICGSNQRALQDVAAAAKTAAAAAHKPPVRIRGGCRCF